MKITRIEVENFRSIKKYDFDVLDFNIFVGQNNNGKTNLFEAIDWYDSGKTEEANYHNHIKTEPIVVRLHYSGAQSGLSGIDNDSYRTAIEKALNGNDSFVIEKTSVTDKRTMIVNSVDVGNPRGFDAALNYFLPKIEYITTRIRLGDVSAYKSKSPIAEMLSGVLSDVVRDDPKYKEFLRLFEELFNSQGSVFRNSIEEIEKRVDFYLQKQFSEGTSIKFKIQDPKLEEILKGFEAEVDDGVNTRAEAKGDGMQRAIMLAIIQSYADYRKENGSVRNFIFLIDEAELHLHPSAQRTLKSALRDIIINGGQVFLNTHSSIFINEHFDRQKIFSIKKTNGVSSVLEIMHPQQRMDSIYQLLGGSPSDLLLPSNFIIVEGQSEEKFLRKIIERFYTENQKCNGIQIIFARGDTEKQKELYHAIHQAYTPLLTNGVYKDKVVFLLDKPNSKQEQHYNSFRKLHPWLIDGEQVHILSGCSIEESYPAKWRKVTGELQDTEKVGYAISVAEQISFEEFKQEMEAMYHMLEKSIEKAYS